MTVAPGDNTGAKPAERLSVCGRKAANSKLVESADAVLRRAVLARLIADPLVSTGHIGVAAIAGQVTLTGYVTSNAQKDAAGAATRRVKGVEQVADEVKVAVPCPAVCDPPAEDLVARQPIVDARTFRPLATMHMNETGDSRPELRP